ncbi:MAG: BMC domain-containing protein [Fusobacteriaceae bacterium]
MGKALGLIEFSKIPTGIYYLDFINKSNFINTLTAYSVCPGKFIALIEGDISAVRGAIESVEANADCLVDTFMLGNPSDFLLEGILGKKNIVENEDSFGIIEGFTVASTVEAADIGLKASGVKLFDLRLARGLCGKSYFILGGTLSEVTHSTEVAKNFLINKGTHIDSKIISNPSADTIDKILKKSSVSNC